MTGRRGFSLVEMVIVLVLAGVVSTAAISMFTTQNKLNATMTALGESQENARSAVQLVASELRSASGGAVALARGDRLVLRMPVAVGVICGYHNPHTKAVYFPIDGRAIDLGRDVDGYAFRSDQGVWAAGYRVRNSDGFNGRTSRQDCIDAGNGAAGTDAQYATLRVDGTIGGAVMIYREITYFFGPSVLDDTRRAFFRARGAEAVELAQGFSEDTRFEYRMSDAIWHPTINTSGTRHIKAIRLLARVAGEGTSGTTTGSASFSLTREIQLRNTQ